MILQLAKSIWFNLALVKRFEFHEEGGPRTDPQSAKFELTFIDGEKECVHDKRQIEAIRSWLVAQGITAGLATEAGKAT